MRVLSCAIVCIIYEFHYQIQQMMFDLFRFFEVFIVIAIAFSVSFAVLFASKNSDFRFGYNLFTLYTMILRGTSSSQLDQAIPVVGALAYILFTGKSSRTVTVPTLRPRILKPLAVLSREVPPPLI